MTNLLYSAKHYQTKCAKSEERCKEYAEVLQNLLPNQENNAGKYLTTNGSYAEWGDLDLTNKANSDLSNVGNANSSFIEKSVRWGIPDYTRGISYAYNTNITAPCDMCVVPIAQGNEGWHGYFYINGVTVVDMTCSGAWLSTCLGVFHVSKGDVFKVVYQGGTSLKGYPLKGTL